MLRILNKINFNGDIVRVATSGSSEISTFSRKERDELLWLGGDLLVTYNNHEADDLSSLFLSEGEAKACLKKRDERLSRSGGE